MLKQPQYFQLAMVAYPMIGDFGCAVFDSRKHKSPNDIFSILLH